MRKYLLTALMALALTTLGFGQVVYEDFEGGADQPWNGSFGDGTFNGVVENPAIMDAAQDPLGINPAGEVGSYTKSGEHSYSLLIAVMENPMDLSVNNQFSIMVNSPVATRVLFKLEGTGEAIEAVKNIAITDKWIKYDFDFSGAAAMTTLNKIIIFFDPGVTESADTYLFDNIVASPAGPCAGTVANPLIVDDFECQRNGTLASPGYLDVTPVANPDASGVNTSAMVGEYNDLAGGAWHALVYDWNTGGDFPLAEGASVIKIKVWTNKAGTLKGKLEGGMSPAIEVDNAVSELNTWVEYSFDFSSQIGADHEKLVFFFNAGVEPEEGDIYYIDDIVFAPVPAAPALEDFEPQKLTWESLGGAAVFGSFDGQIANPDASGANTSANVGQYTKGSSEFGGLKANLPGDFTIETFPQLNLDVWAPANATTVTMKLFSPTQGLVDASATLSTTQAWETLSFTFEEFQTITDFERVEIQFGNTANSGIWYFDNLTQGQSTVDPCEGVEPIAGIVDDFDCQRNVAIGAGAGALTVVANPVPGGLNADPLDKVGQYTDPFDEWSALVYDYGEAMDLTNRNQLSVLIYSPITTNLLFKLEGGTVAPVEIPIDIATANSWVQYQIDFSDAADVDHTRLVIFFQAGSIPAQENVYYVDDVQWKPQPIRGCVANFEEPDFTLETWTYFGNADLDGAAAGVVVDNPDPDAVNMSAKVGRFEEAVGGQVWAGMYADTPAPMVMPTDNKTATMKVWMDHAGPVVMKMEGGIDGAPGSGDVSSDYSSPNEWAELTFDFSHLPDNAAYGRVTLIMDIGSAPETDNRISYFDDISIAGEPCIATGLFQPAPEVAALRVMPNPAHDLLRVDQPENVRTFRIQNLFGQTLQTLSIAGVPGQVQMDISNLEAGMYLLTAYDAQGRLVANSKFIKQ